MCSLCEGTFEERKVSCDKKIASFILPPKSIRRHVLILYHIWVVLMALLRKILREMILYKSDALVTYRSLWLDIALHQLCLVCVEGTFEEGNISHNTMAIIHFFHLKVCSKTCPCLLFITTFGYVFAM